MKTASLVVARSFLLTALNVLAVLTAASPLFADVPTVSSVTTSPTLPTYLDGVRVTANVQASSGHALSQVKLTYISGTGQTVTVFSESMRSAAAQPWIGDGCDNSWTVTAAAANNVRQTTGANHGPGGNPCGLEFAKGTSAPTDTMAATTNSINATGTSGWVEFWVATKNLVAANGWTFQVSADGGATYATRASELTGTSHAYQLYHYDLAATELTASLKLRFQMAGYTPLSGTPSPIVDIDDIVVSITSAPVPVTIPMFDDGLHGDGVAGDGIYGALIPAQPGASTMSYTVSAADDSGGTALSATGSYGVSYNLTDETFTSSEFLGVPTRCSVKLNMEASVNLELYVEYGPAAGNYTGQTPTAVFPTGSPLEQTIQAPTAQTPLLPNTRYHYRVRYRQPGETVFKSRGDRGFQTQRPRGTPYVFTITADPHLDDVTSPDLLSLTMANAAADNPDFHIDLGDILMTDKLSQIIPSLTVNYQAIVNRAISLRSFFGAFCHSVPFFFTLGNHEGEYGYLYNADTSAGKDNNFASWDLQARKLYYPTPIPDLVSPVPDIFYTGDATMKLVFGAQQLLEDYYAWEWGDALFVVLNPFWNTLTDPNTNPADNWHWSLGKTQYDWLKQTLQTSTARYEFVFLHHLVGGVAEARGGVEVAGMYEWGGKNLDGSDGFAAHRPGWDMPIHQLLLANRVTAVFHGHDHFYDRQQLDGIAYQECPQPGTPLFSTGSQVDGQYTTGTILPNSGHLRVTVSPDAAKIEYVRVALPSQETTTLHNRDVADAYTVAPVFHSEIIPPTRVGNDAVITWDALRGENYTVQWSTDLLNWTSVQVGETNTWTDPAAFAAQTTPKKFYRVVK